MARPPGTLDGARLALLARLARYLHAAGGKVPDEVRRAVNLLVVGAAPDRADRLGLAPHDPPIVVERLAVWALQRTTDEAVADAGHLIDRAGVDTGHRAPDQGSDRPWRWRRSVPGHGSTAA